MKALVFDRFSESTDALEFRDVELPEPGPADVIVHVKASALNFNDIWGRRGRPLQVPLPHVSGTDAAGLVEAVGDAVTTVKVGDSVVVHAGHSCRACAACTGGEEFFCRDFKLYGFQTGPLVGTHAEYCRIQAAQAVPKPDNVSWEEAASMPLCLTTAWRMLITRARIRAGDTVLVWGAAGGLGIFATQIANLAGAHAIAVVGSAEKAEFVDQFQPAAIIDRSAQDVVAEVRQLTGKLGVDVVFEHTGEETWEQSIQALRRGGTIVVCGATSGYRANTDLRFLWNKQQNLLGSHVGTRAETEASLARVAAGEIRPAVAEVMPLREASRAQRLMEGRDVCGKIVFTAA